MEAVRKEAKDLEGSMLKDMERRRERERAEMERGLKEREE